MDRDIRVFPDADAKVMRLDPRERGTWIGETIGIPCEIEPRLDFPCGASVERDDVGRHFAFAQSCRHFSRFFRRFVIGARYPKAEAPARNPRRAPSQLRVAIDDSGGRVSG